MQSELHGIVFASTLRSWKEIETNTNNILLHTELVLSIVEIDKAWWDFGLLSGSLLGGWFLSW